MIKDQSFQLLGSALMWLYVRATQGHLYLDFRCPWTDPLILPLSLPWTKSISFSL